MKFGGSSVGTAEAITQVTGLVARFRDVKPVLVVSALQGITDQILTLADLAVAGRTKDVSEGIAALRRRHLEVVAGAVGDDVVCIARINALVDALAVSLGEVARLHECDDRHRDHLVSFGERLSAPIVSAALAAHDIPSADHDARDLVVTDARFGAANVRFAETDERIRGAIVPHVERGAVPVITGFIAATEKGETTTLGRGGSDYSVAVVAGALDAEEIWIWKEVDGIMTADPRVVREARLLPSVTYDEAAEMSHFGAKVLHPKTMIPAVDKNIPVRMRNTFRPDAPGTVIGATAIAAPAGVKVVTAIKKLAMVTIEGRGMTGVAGLAAHVFAVAGREGINILMFSQSSSEQNICLVCDAKEGRRFKDTLDRELVEEKSSRLVDRVSIRENVAAIAAVGEGMRGVPGIAARLFRATASAGVSVFAIAQGSSERNISFIVPEDVVDDVVRAVHAAFALHALEFAQEVVAEGAAQ